MVQQFTRLAKVGEAMTEEAKIDVLIDGIQDQRLQVLKKIIRQDLSISNKDVLAKLHLEELAMMMTEVTQNPSTHHNSNIGCC